MGDTTHNHDLGLRCSPTCPAGPWLRQPIPIDPSSPLEDQATMLHELYQGFQAAGFSEERAFQLLLFHLSHALGMEL